VGGRPDHIVDGDEGTPEIGCSSFDGTSVAGEDARREGLTDTRV
jgi:hypothetical protein